MPQLSGESAHGERVFGCGRLVEDDGPYRGLGRKRELVFMVVVVFPHLIGCHGYGGVVNPLSGIESDVTDRDLLVAVLILPPDGGIREIDIGRHLSHELVLGDHAPVVRLELEERKIVDGRRRQERLILLDIEEPVR